MNTDTRMVLSYDEYESVDEPPPGRKLVGRGLHARSLSNSNNVSALILPADEWRLEPYSTLLGDGRAG